MDRVGMTLVPEGGLWRDLAAAAAAGDTSAL
jgi:hypothetical protein